MVILIDTSVWIDYLRGQPTEATHALDRVVREGPALLATCDPVRAELLSGPTDMFTVRRIEAQLGTLESLEVDSAADFDEAARLSRVLRRQGTPPRSLIDCLIAAIAMRHDAELWHKDIDFVRIAGLEPLRHRDLRAVASRG